MAQAEIGLIGLGVMGSNLALNIAEKGHAVAVYNRTTSKTGAFFESAGELRQRIVPCTRIEDLVKAIRPPRPIILMVSAGSAVDEVTVALSTIVVGGAFASTVTTRVKVALPGAKLAMLQLTVPLPPTAGVVQLQPPAEESEVNVVLAGMALVSVTLLAVLGPALPTVMV